MNSLTRQPAAAGKPARRAKPLNKFTENIAARADLRVAYVVDPRFPGGTSAAVAAELEIVARLARLEVHALDTQMFEGKRVSPLLADTLAKLKIPLRWQSREISADIVLFHNPSCLKFQQQLGPRIVARHLIVVTHENFQRPGGAEAFDVENCLSQIAGNSITLRRSLAPVSAWNRQTVMDWLRNRPLVSNWSVLPSDWFNIFDLPNQKPTSKPRDRRGRVSRPGPEKFPGPQVMNMCFPKTAHCNVILGADALMRRQDIPKHLMLYPFGSLPLAQFFDRIDFMIYYTAPTWRESFGRVIAEAIAAGKLVVTDKETAKPFDGGAIAATPREVDEIIAGYLKEPERYQDDVLQAQKKLSQFSGRAFEKMFKTVSDQSVKESI